MKYLLVLMILSSSNIYDVKDVGVYEAPNLEVCEESGKSFIKYLEQFPEYDGYYECQKLENN